MQADNRGIEAIVLGSIYSIQNARSGVAFTTLSGRYSHTQTSGVDIDLGSGEQLKEFRLVGIEIPILLLMSVVYRILPNRLRSKFLDTRPILMAYVSADVVIGISAGDSFSDIYGYRQFISHYLIDLVAIVLRKPLVIFPQTIGPFERAFSRLLARYMLKRARMVFTRERFSTITVEDLCGGKADIVEKDDMAFLLRPVQPVGGGAFSSNRETVGMNISGYIYSNRSVNLLKDFDYFRLMRKLVDLFIDEFDVDVLFVPHDYSRIPKIDDDLVACDALLSTISDRHQGRVSIVREHLRAASLKSIVGNCSFFIGSRLHSCIAALSMGIPAVPLAYSYKYRGVMEKIGLEDLVCDPRVEEEAAILARVRDFYINRDELTRLLKTRLPAVIDSALSCGLHIDGLI